MTNSFCDGDIRLLAEKIRVASQAVSDDIEPLTPDDCFTTGVDTQDHLARLLHHISVTGRTLFKKRLM